MLHTKDNIGAAVTTVTSEMMNVEGEPLVQTRPEARVVTVPTLERNRTGYTSTNSSQGTQKSTKGTRVTGST